jgi:DNA topoisomerase 2-associated protein PAT1
MTPEQKEALTAQAAKQAKRNHKIFLLSRDNGLMTPQDKNFITRIQLQQLVSATGNPNEHGTDETLAEDFYYQVYTQIQGLQRQHPNQPLTNFAQTYLYQTGSRQGNRRMQNRGPENHMQRMEQQVQRAVEAAKNKPKNKQLVIEGSLGKISFSNSKTPKPLLNLKRQDSETQRPGSSSKDPHAPSAIDKKSVLRAIEQVYGTLMKMEDHDRRMPPPPQEGDEESVRRNGEWREKAAALNDKLWRELKVHDPIGATPVHPFIAFLSYAKGKKAIPRVFRHISHEQRKTILTIIIIHLDKLDVVRGAEIVDGEQRLDAAMRENVELFSQTVMSSLFNFMNDIGLDIVTGVMGLISDHINVDLVAKTRIGASMLTLILSRAAILKQGGAGDEEGWKNWFVPKNQLFLSSSHSLTLPGTGSTITSSTSSNQPCNTSSRALSALAKICMSGSSLQHWVLAPTWTSSSALFLQSRRGCWTRWRLLARCRLR